MSILCDIDGVLADFYAAFSALLSAEFGVPVYTTQTAPSWDLGYTDDQIKRGFEIISKTPNFWLTVPPLATPHQLRRLADAHHEVPVIFVTARTASAGRSVYHQTVRWLEDCGIKEPLVVTVKRAQDKLPLLERFNPYILIEDSPMVALEAARLGTTTALMDWKYTEHVVHSNITRCNLTEALTIAGIP